MLRSSIIQGCHNVLHALTESGFADMASSKDPQSGETLKENVGNLIEASMKYRVFSSNFGEGEKDISKIMSLDHLGDHQWLATMVGELSEGMPIGFSDMRYNVNFSTRHIPKFINLLEPKDITAEFYEKDRNKRLEKEYSGITIILIEEEGQSSSIKRLILALYSVESLYEVCSKVEKQPNSNLTMVACDSGSDKSFSFTGFSAAVERLKDTIILIWERAVFYKEMQGSHRIKNIAESLPILKEISEMHENDNLSAEEAEILKRQTINSVTQFLEAGIITPEISEMTSFNPRQLLAPEPKLLTHFGQDDAPSTDDPNQNENRGSQYSNPKEIIETLNPEERRALLDKLREENDESEI